MVLVRSAAAASTRAAAVDYDTRAAGSRRARVWCTQYMRQREVCRNTVYLRIFTPTFRHFRDKRNTNVLRNGDINVTSSTEDGISANAMH